MQHRHAKTSGDGHNSSIVHGGSAKLATDPEYRARVMTAKGGAEVAKTSHIMRKVALAPVFSVALALCLSLASTEAQADNETGDSPREDGRQCISISQIKRTRVVDDQTVLFYLSGGRVKKVSLAFRCSSLKFHNSFSYRSYTGRLCARVDGIIARSGAHCPIADISAISKDEAKQLIRESRKD